MTMRYEPTRICALARYLIANPIRPGRVDRVGDYPYWNAAWLKSGATERDLLE